MPNPVQRYVRKVNDSYVFGWTSALAALPGFVECDKNGRQLDSADPDVTEIIEQLRRENEQLRAMTAGLEAASAEENPPPSSFYERTSEQIKGLKSLEDGKAQLATYALEQFGETFDDRMSFDMAAEQVLQWAREADTAAEQAAAAGQSGDPAAGAGL